MKFEETVEHGGDRWSKPFVSSLSLHSVFELRSCLLNGVVVLDAGATSMDQIAGNIERISSGLFIFTPVNRC